MPNIMPDIKAEYWDGKDWKSLNAPVADWEKEMTNQVKPFGAEWGAGMVGCSGVVGVVGVSGIIGPYISAVASAPEPIKTIEPEPECRRISVGEEE